jgi:DNA-binding CsgD family transcriptional regulator
MTMTIADPFEVPFQETLQQAHNVARSLLRLQLGTHTSEDVVSMLIEKELRTGKSLSEIQEALSGPGMYRRLENVKNDIFRWETAKKRGSKQQVVSLEDVESFRGVTADNLETELIRKEDFAHMKDVLTHLLEKVQLSQTQLEILNLDQKGWSSKRIARELGIDVDSVYARRSEALRKLALAAKRLSQHDK